VNELTRDYFRTGFRRWIRWIAIATIFAVACGFLANWQLNRRIQVVKVIARIDRNYDHTVSTLQDLVKNVSGFSVKYEYRPVLVSGHYLADKALLLRNQINDGNAGFHQLVPFAMDSGRVVVIDRGWISTGENQDLPDSIPTVPTGKIQLVGRLIHAQQPDSRKAPIGQAMSITPPVLNKQWGVKATDLYVGAYLRLAVESPSSASLPVLFTKPDLTEGNHLSYAFQWVLFALLGFAAIGANVRQDLIEKRTAEDSTYVPKPRRKRLGDSDKEEEDALLDG
jgi:cytochrome oxidase assembly protein ShyY1